MRIPTDEYCKNKTKFFEKIGFNEKGFSYHELSRVGFFVENSQAIEINLGFNFFTRELELWCFIDYKPFYKLEMNCKNKYEEHIEDFKELCFRTKKAYRDMCSWKG